MFIFAEQLLILSRWSGFWSPKEREREKKKRFAGNEMGALIYSCLRQTNERLQRSPESRKKKKENDEALVPSSMKNCCSAQCCSSITLLKSTLLLSLLTPALDGLLSTPLLPSRLLGTEFGDASEPGGVKVWGRQEETNRLETLCRHVRRFHSFWLVCFVIHWVTRTSRFVFLKKNEEVKNSTAVYDGVGLAQEKWPPPHFLHCFYSTCHFDPLYDPWFHVSRHDFG